MKRREKRTELHAHRKPCSQHQRAGVDILSQMFRKRERPINSMTGAAQVKGDRHKKHLSVTHLSDHEGLLTATQPSLSTRAGGGRRSNSLALGRKDQTLQWPTPFVCLCVRSHRGNVSVWVLPCCSSAPGSRATGRRSRPLGCKATQSSWTRLRR